MHSLGEEWAYEIDSNERIVAVSDNWDAFALENDGEEACARHVLGRPWTDFVSGLEALQLWMTVLKRVRESGHSVAVPLRCDGPSVRRFLSVTITPGPDRTVGFRSRILREEPRDPVALLDRNCVRDDTFMKVCGWCSRAELNGAWVEIETAIQVLRPFEVHAVPALTHGICSDCLRRFFPSEAKGRKEP